MIGYQIQAVAEANKVTWDQPGSLIDEHAERMLAVAAGFAPIDGCRLIGDAHAVERDMFAVAPVDPLNTLDRLC